MYIGTTRVMNNQLPGVTKRNLYRCNWLCTRFTWKPPFSGISMVQQLNAIYGMANYSLGNVVKSKTS